MDLKEVGHTIQIAGIIYNSDKDEKTYLLMLPGEELYIHNVLHSHFSPETKYMTHQEWKNFFWQTDVLETEINRDGKKTIIKKAERQISQITSWNVFRRDEYTCRYCGRNDVPLTVDHIVLWEDGGPSIEENLVAACKKCNRTRGNMKYEDWVGSSDYKEMSKDISLKHAIQNSALVHTMKKIPTSFKKLRGKKR